MRSILYHSVSSPHAQREHNSLYFQLRNILLFDMYNYHGGRPEYISSSTLSSDISRSSKLPSDWTSSLTTGNRSTIADRNGICFTSSSDKKRACKYQFTLVCLSFSLTLLVRMQENVPYTVRRLCVWFRACAKFQMLIFTYMYICVEIKLY